MMGLRRLMVSVSGRAPIIPTNRIDVTTTRLGSASTTHLIDAPPVVAPNDLLILQLSTSGPASVTLPPDWTLADLLPNSAGTNLAAVAYRVADGSESGSKISVTTGSAAQMVADVHRIRAGTHSGLVSVFGVADTGENPAPPGLPIPWGASVNTAIVTFASNFNSPATAYPVDYREGRSVASIAATGQSASAQIGSALRGEIAEDSTAPGIFTLTNPRSWSAQTVLVAPGGIPPLAAPALLDQRGDYFAADVAIHPVSLPAQVDAGDLLLLFFANHGTTLPTIDTGWSVLYQDSGGTVQTSSAFFRLAAGVEGGTTVNITTANPERGTACVMRIQAGTFDGATAPAVGPRTANSSDTMSAGAMSPPWGLADNLFIAVATADNRRALESDTVIGYPSGAFTPSGGAVSLSTSASVYVAHAPFRSGQSWPAVFAPLTNAQTWTARTVAIKPATS